MMAVKNMDDFKVQGEVLFNEPMSKHTSWRVGGPADIYFKPDSIADLQKFMQQLDAKLDVTFIGLGSNVLVRDGGLRGAVIAPLGGLKGIDLQDDLLCVEAGVSCSKFARYCAKNDFVGVDFLAGIPGTIGGAAAMNAGAFGSETWEFVKHITVINRQGELSVVNKADLNIQYRQINLDKGLWIVSVCFDLNRLSDSEYKHADIKSLLEKRNSSQPIGLPSCGSVFRNPNNDYAARLIESCGLKGFSIGKAYVSEKHANFIISEAGCLSSDIEQLIDHVYQTVLDETDVSLILEAHVMGDEQ